MLLTVFSLLIFTTSIGEGLTPSLVFSLSPNEMRGQLLAITGLFAIIVTAACPMLIGFPSDHVFLATKGLLFAVSAVSIAGAAASVPSFIMGFRPTAVTLLWRHAALPVEPTSPSRSRGDTPPGDAKSHLVRFTARLLAD